MEKKISYYIHIGHSPSPFWNQVEEYLNEGWKLEGGVCVFEWEHPETKKREIKFAQAMTKEEVKKQ